MSYGKIFSKFWTDPKIRSYSDDGKLLAAYLLSSPHRNLIGCCRLPIGYICDDLQWTADRVAVGLTELASGNRPFIVRDPEGWTHIVNSLRYDKINGLNHFKAAAKLIEMIPRDSAVFASVAPKLTEIWQERIHRIPQCLIGTFAAPSELPLEDLRTPAPAPPPAPAPKTIEGSSTGERVSASRVRASAALLPEGWVPSQSQIGYASKMGLVNGAVSREAAKFERYWTVGNGAGTKRTAKGWEQTWSNWIAKAARDPHNSRSDHGNRTHLKQQGASGFAGVLSENRAARRGGDTDTD